MAFFPNQLLAVACGVFDGLLATFRKEDTQR